MYELPEIVTLARQIADELTGAKITSCERGNSPHKWVWYSRDAEEYEKICVGRTIGTATPIGNRVVCPVEPGYMLQIGDMGGKMLLHTDDSTFPKKRHFLLGFEDGRFLTVKVAGWGGIWLLADDEPVPYYGLRKRVSPIGDGFTYDRFKEVLEEDRERGKRSVKAFLASESLIDGIGNGYVQDICFNARLHPKRDTSGLTGRERQRFYHAMRKTLAEAIKLGGRDSETNLYGEPGGYVARMDRRAKGQPCPECGTEIEKISYLGGSCYFCPQCQPLTGNG
jgi:formamidopyrimidine-DNA glycosylase